MSGPTRIPVYSNSHDGAGQPCIGWVEITAETLAPFLATAMERIAALEKWASQFPPLGIISDGNGNPQSVTGPATFTVPAWCKIPAPVAADTGCESWGHRGPFYNGWCETCRKERAALLPAPIAQPAMGDPATVSAKTHAYAVRYAEQMTSERDKALARVAELEAKLAEATVWEKHAEDAMRRARLAEDKAAELERERNALKDRLEELRYR